MSTQLRTRWSLGILLALFICALAGTPATSAEPQNPAMTSAAFHDAMRKLWEDHITYTRLYIVSAVGNLPDKSATAARLMQNQTDIGNAIKPFYGAAAGNKLTALLKTHIAGAVAVLDAAKTGNNAKVAVATKSWFTNADEIAAFLHGANPKAWPLDALQMHMHSHLNLTLAEATAQLQGKYAASDSDYDKVHSQILELADALSSGIVQQYPSDFKTP